jgi:DNA-binding MarR family transcriptional regulator
LRAVRDSEMRMPGARSDENVLATTEVQLAYEVRETSRALLQALKTRLEAHKITLGQYFFIRQLELQEGVSQAQISGSLQTTTAASVPTIDALERRGLIKRVRDLDDRRVTRIFLTPKGRVLWKKLTGYAYELGCTAATGLSVRQMQTLRSLLAVLRTNLEHAPALERAV